MPITNIPPFDPGKHGWLNKNFELKVGVNPADYNKLLKRLGHYLYENQWYGGDFDLRAVEDLLSEYSLLYTELFNAGKDTIHDVHDWFTYKEKLDYLLTQHAVRMHELYAEWEEAARRAARENVLNVVSFGVPVEAGVGEAGKAYYAPETLAPYPGFDIQTISQSLDAEPRTHNAHFAFTFDKITEVTEETRTKIMSAVSHFRLNGGNTHDVMQYITGVLGIKPEKGTYWSTIGTLSGVTSKTENIFRTEIMASQNTETWMAIQQIQHKHPEMKVRQMWMATGDFRTRDSHLAAHGQHVAADLPFTVGGHFAMFPGDPKLPPEERCRCRCRVVPWREGWGDPDVVLGDVNRKVAAERERRRLEREAKDRTKNPKKPVPSSAVLSAKAVKSMNESGVDFFYTAGDQILIGEQDYTDWKRDPNSVSPEVRSYLDARKFIHRNGPEENVRKEMRYGDITVHSDKNRGEAKDRIVSELSRRTGVPYNYSNMFIKQWSHTSNGNDMRSMSIQRSAAELFGEAQLSPWQRKSIQELEEMRAKAEKARDELYNQYIAAGGAHPVDAQYMAMDAWGNMNLNPSAHYSLFEDPNREGAVWSDLAVLGFQSGSEVEKALLQAMYDFTQEELAQQGITEVLLMRGETSPAQLFDNLHVHDTYMRWGNAMSSYAPNRETADGFSFTVTQGEVGTIHAAIFPAERIIGTSRTGFGCLGEWEYVVLGGGVEDTVTLAQLVKR